MPSRKLFVWSQANAIDFREPITKSTIFPTLSYRVICQIDWQRLWATNLRSRVRVLPTATSTSSETNTQGSTNEMWASQLRIEAYHSPTNSKLRYTYRWKAVVSTNPNQLPEKVWIYWLRGWASLKNQKSAIFYDGANLWSQFSQKSHTVIIFDF